MRKKRILMLIGSVCLAMMLLVPLAVSCGPATPEEAAEEIAALESNLAAEKTKVSGLQGEVSDLEAEIAALKVPAEVYEFRLQTVTAASDNWIYQQYTDVVEAMSSGRIKISVFANSEIVTMEELPDAVAQGMITMGNLHPDMVAGVVPVGQLESAPMLWRNFDEKLALIYEYGIEDIYKEAFGDKYGFHVIGVTLDSYGGLIFTKEINSLADLKGLRIHVWEPLGEILHELTGSIASPMAPEDLYTSLALGVLDGAEWGGASGMTDLGFHEIGKTFLLPYHQISYAPFYFINMGVWNELPADLQAILTGAVYENSIFYRWSYVGKELVGLNKMRDAGVKITYLPEEDVEAIFQKSLAWLQTDFSQMSPYAKRASDICVEALRAFGRID